MRPPASEESLTTSPYDHSRKPDVRGPPSSKVPPTHPAHRRCYPPRRHRSSMIADRPEDRPMFPASAGRSAYQTAHWLRWQYPRLPIAPQPQRPRAQCSQRVRLGNHRTLMPRTGSSVAGRQDFGRTTWSVDLVRVGADGSLHWLRVWPTPEEHPRHAGLELSGISDRQQARDLVRLVPGRERLTIERESPRPRMPPSYRWLVPVRCGRWRPGWHEWQSRRPQRLVRR